jgi:undecaprenyl-diphosphatase
MRAPQARAPSASEAKQGTSPRAPPANVIGLDQRVEGWVVQHRAEPFDTFFVALSHIGSYGIVWLTLALLAVWLLRRPLVFPLMVAAYFTSAALSDAIKLSVDRARPVDHPLVHAPTTHSFPSGHAMTSFACAATLAPFVGRRGAVVLYLLAAGIAYSRVYVGVHFPLDVLGGAALGLLIATALRLLPAALRRSRRAQRAG